MTSYNTEYLDDLEKRPTPDAHNSHRARAYWHQLISGGLGHKVVSEDKCGPVEVIRYGLEDSRWVRVSKEKRGLLFELVPTLGNFVKP